jgi:hypothetical protein
VTPKVWVEDSKCCSYDFPNELAGTIEKYQQPRHAFSNAADAEAWVATLKPSMPFFYPFNENVQLGGGWLYNSGGFHAGMKMI